MKARLLCGVMLIVALIVTIFCILVGPDRALSEEASPSPSPSATATEAPIVLPTAEQTAWAKAWHRRAVKERRKLAKVRRCFGAHAPVAACGLPGRGASAETWVRAGRKCRYQARDWRAKVKAGLQKMRRPGGTSNGVRWMPLARYVGWPESTLGNLAYIIMRESSGRPRALNPSSGCAGLLQIHPCHGVANPFDPEVNLRFGLKLYRQVGWSPWAL